MSSGRPCQTCPCRQTRCGPRSGRQGGQQLAGLALTVAEMLANSTGVLNSMLRVDGVGDVVPEGHCHHVGVIPQKDGWEDWVC